MQKRTLIDSIFSRLRSQDIPYMVLRGFAEIPSEVNLHNDIDLLCKNSNKEQIIETFKSLKFKYYIDSKISNQYLYHAQPHYHFTSRKLDLHFDVVFNLAYRSPNNGEWVSVHQYLQDSIWNNMIKVNQSWIFQPHSSDLIIHILCHCIFDKKRFDDKHVKCIENELVYVNIEDLASMLELIFFKFTIRLIQYVQCGRYNDILREYLSFSEY